MSGQLDDIGSTEDKRNCWRQISEPSIKTDEKVCKFVSGLSLLFFSIEYVIVLVLLFPEQMSASSWAGRSGPSFDAAARAASAAGGRRSVPTMR